MPTIQVTQVMRLTKREIQLLVSGKQIKTSRIAYKKYSDTKYFSVFSGREELFVEVVKSTYHEGRIYLTLKYVGCETFIY